MNHFELMESAAKDLKRRAAGEVRSQIMNDMIFHMQRKAAEGASKEYIDAVKDCIDVIVTGGAAK